MSLNELSIRQARDFRQRLLGLMFKSSLPDNSGLLLAPCGSVHTFFMRFALDLVYLDDAARIVRLVESLPPWRFNLGCAQARQTLELPAGSIQRFGLRLGDSLAGHPAFKRAD